MATGDDCFFSNKELQIDSNKIIGKKILHFKTIDSTNKYSIDLIKKGISEGTVVISDIQTKGRGRKKRYWNSPLGGLWFSIILYPEINPEKAMLITMVASISISQAIKKVTGLDTEIKWPNDLLLNNKKLCGILTEIESEQDSITYAVIAIGINVNNKITDELKNIAISIREFKDTEISINKLFSEILKSFDFNYRFVKEKKFDNIRNSWLSYSKIIDREVEIKEEDNILTGVVSDIDENGHLIINTSKGEVRFTVGDIKYL